jgi:hypothetical protein
MTVKRFVRALVVVALVLRASQAIAQGTSQQQAASPAFSDQLWEFEVHGGTALPLHGTDGSQSLPVTGTAVSGLISASTFFFGAGNQLFNQNQSGFAGPSAPTIATLDPIVVGPAVQWREWAIDIGVRLNHRLGRRFALEFTGDYRRSALQYSDDALSAIEASRASFIPALTRALAGASPPPVVTSVVTMEDGESAPQVLATGGILVNLKTTGRTIPYVVGGGGARFTFGNTPNASVTGTYQFGASSQITGIDTVELQYAFSDRDYFGYGGGGVRYYASPGWGIRVDARAEILRNQIENIVTVTPARGVRSGGAPFPIVTAGALQFSSTAPLTGPVISGVTTFSGRNFDIHVNITAGIFWRF